MASDGLKNDIANFLIDRRMMSGLYHKGVVAYGDAAALVLQILGHADSSGPLSRRGMRESVRKHAATLAASRPDVHNLRMEDGAFEVDLFPDVLNHFTKSSLTAQDMDEIYEMVGPPSRQPTQKRRYVRTSLATGAASSSQGLVGAIEDVPADDEGVVAIPARPPAAEPSSLVPYDRMDRDALAVRLEQRDEEVAQLKEELRKVRRSRVFYMQKAEGLEVDLYEANQEIVALKAQATFRPGRNVTTYGGYCLAVRRNVGHASAAATALMVTGEGEGGVKDKNAVVSYEHRAAAGKVIRSKVFYSEPEGVDLSQQLEIHLLKCDGTNSELIQKKKVHVSMVHSSLCDVSEAAACPGGVAPASVAEHVESQSVSGDLLTVTKDNGPEVHAFMLTHLQSVYCPTWKSRASASDDQKFFASVYVFGVDAGPGNQWALKQIKEDLRGSSARVMFCAVFCFMHQLHLIVKDLLDRTEGFDWGPLKEGKRYWGTVATVANVWRSCGAPTRIFQAAIDVPGGGLDVAHRYFKKMPGRPLRGRWGSVAAVERLIISAKTFIGAVFKLAFGKDEAGPAGKAKAKAKPKAKGAAKADAQAKRRAKVGDDEEAEYRKQQGDWRGTAVAMTGDSLWLAMVHISYIVKQPLTEYLYSSQKKKGEYEKQDFPLLLLRVLDKPCDEDSGDRRAIARTLLRKDRGDLVTVNGDFAAKARELFMDDWRGMEASGQCSAKLFVFLLVWRSKLPHDTQDLEGANSVLQRMAKLAPNLHLPLASDRLRLKLGTPIRANECVDLHPAIMNHFSKQEFHDRFEPVVVAREPAGAAPPPPPALPRYNAAIRAAARYAHAAGPLMPNYMEKAFTFGLDAAQERHAFLMCWSYHQKVSCATGKLRPMGGGHCIFHLDRPIRISSLTEVIGEMAMAGKGKGKLGARAPLPLRSGTLGWLSLDRATFSDETEQEVVPKPPKIGRGGEPEDDGLEDFVGAAMGDVMEDDEGEYEGPVGGGEGEGGDDDLAGHPAEENLDEEGAIVPEPEEFDPVADDGGDVGVNSDDGPDESPDGHGPHGHGGPHPDGPDLPVGGDSPVAGPPPAAPATPPLASVANEGGILVRQSLAKAELEAAHRRAEERRGAPMSYGAIGMVAKPDGSCSFVLWTQPTRQKARPVRIDGEGRIMSMVHFAQPETDYADVEVIIGNTGLVQPYALRKHERPAVDAWLLLLQMERNTRFFQGPLALKDNNPRQCVKCDIVGPEDAGIDLADPTDGGDLQFYR
ncbi:unnamed protein product, partial [Prorocentrum cordatum]